MRIAALYDARLVAAPEHRAMGAALRDAFAATVAGVLSITGHARLSDGNPTLRHLIGMRGPHVDPLNVVQVETLARLRAEPESTQLRDLLMLTINGVAAGMRNTVRQMCIFIYKMHSPEAPCTSHRPPPPPPIPPAGLTAPPPTPPDPLDGAPAAAAGTPPGARALIILCPVQILGTSP
jgi:hypothetical protein